MNILNVHLSYTPNVGGVDTILYHQCNELVLRGHKVYVLTKSIPGTPKQESMKGVSVIRAEYFPHFDTTTLPILTKHVDRLIRTEDIDIVTFWNLNTWCLSGLSSELPSDVRKFLVPIDFFPVELSEFLIGNSAWDGFITFTRPAASDTTKFGAPSEKILTVSPGVKLESYDVEYADRVPSQSENLVLCPARLDPIKGHRDLLEAVSSAKHNLQEMKLLLLTPGSIWWHVNDKVKRQILGLIRDMKLAEVVSFADLVGIEDMPNYYSQARVVVLPSYSESIGLVTLEAMASGRPVIASNVGPMGEFIREARSGLVVEPGDWKTLASSLVEILSSKDKQKQLGRNGRAYVEANHDIRDAVSHLEKFYNQS